MITLKRWIQKQQQILDSKDVVVRYIFMENIQTIKLYGDNTSKIKIVTKDGGEVILRDVAIEKVSDLEMQIDDNIDELAREIDEEFNLDTSSMNPFKNSKAGDQCDDALGICESAKQETLIELQGRISDFMALSNIYFPSPSHEIHGHRPTTSTFLVKEDMMAQVIENIEERHDQIRKRLSSLPPPPMNSIEPEIDEMLKENNEQWQYLVYQMGKEMKDVNATALQMELDSRTAALEKVLC